MEGVMWVWEQTRSAHIYLQTLYTFRQHTPVPASLHISISYLLRTCNQTVCTCFIRQLLLQNPSASINTDELASLNL